MCVFIMCVCIYACDKAGSRSKKIHMTYIEFEIVGCIFTCGMCIYSNWIQIII